MFVLLATVEYCEMVARHCRSFGTVGLVNCYISSLKWGSHDPSSKVEVIESSGIR